MLIIDLTAAAFLVGMTMWGIRAGVPGTVVVASFAAGAAAGAALAPLALTDGQESDFALAVALPAALLAGALLAAAVERRMSRLRRRAHGRGVASATGGAVLAAWVGAVALWLLGGAAAQIGQLRDRVEDSTVIGGLDSVLSALGPRENAAKRTLAPFPIVAGAGPPIGPADPEAVNDPDVRLADRSVVRISAGGCGRFVLGSGWVAGPGVVVTNAHVVAVARVIRVQLRGRGPRQPARAIWFDPANDVAILRVPALRGVRALPIVRAPRRDVPGAALGFPGGYHSIRAARLGPTKDTFAGRMGDLPRNFPRDLAGRLVTTFRARAEPGSSGGPVVDTRGRVLTTVFGGRVTRQSALGVPNRIVRSGLRRAGPTVGTGRCGGVSADSQGR